MANRYHSKFAWVVGLFNLNPSYYAVTIGQTTYYSCDKASVDNRPHWRCHEDRHKDQYTEIGSTTKFLRKYIWATLTKGYKNNPYEIDARAHEADWRLPGYKQKPE